MFPIDIFPKGGQTRKHCFLAIFPEGRQTRKHCFLAMSPKGGQTRKHCFLVMFPEGGQTRKHCSFLAMFPEGGRTRKHCKNFTLVCCKQVSRISNKKVNIAYRLDVLRQNNAIGIMIRAVPKAPAMAAKITVK